MPAPDDATFRLLHEIRLRGVVELEETDTVTLLVGSGFVVQSARGVRITAEGRVTHASWARLPPGAEIEQVAQRAYERFLPLNRELLRICNDWQVRAGGVPNDHRDASYDWSVLDRLHALDERVGPIVSRVGRAVERFAVYRPRLRAALARVDEGATEWLTSPRIDSYHTVWMQMHEDLLLAIGGDRATEAAPEAGS
ncbi:MAG TPA: MarR family transcriptional regulator [Acidimicrobiia bacterium]|nr:MarR family transcriptional regulator [Acidimicrobiia bacterium]